MSQTIQLRRDTAADWTRTDPVLFQGEVGIETDTGKAKLGDGITAWNSLAYWVTGSGAVSSVNGKTGVVTLAAGDVGALPVAGGTMQGWLAPAVAALSGAATVLVNAALGNAFNLTLTSSSWTMGSPSNPADGQVIRFRVTQGGGGNFTLAWGTAYDFGAGSAPTLSTAAGKVDIIAFEYMASLSK